MGKKKKNKKIIDISKDENKVETEVEVEFTDGKEAEVIDSEDVAQEEKLSEEEILKQKNAELEDKLLRTVADFDNYKKRLIRRHDETVEASIERLLTQILEIVDNFERAIQHNDEKADVETVIKGTELIYNQMLELLKKYEVTPLDSIGESFDPNYHEALMQVDSEEFPEGSIAVEINKGYKKGNKVLRHSKVGVSKGAAEKEKETE